MSTRRLAWAALAVSALLFGGCSSMQSSEEAPVGDATGGAGGGAAGARGSQWTGGALDDPSSPLSKRVVYFDYDSVELMPESRDVLRAHGSYLSSNRVVSHGDGGQRSAVPEAFPVEEVTPLVVYHVVEDQRQRQPVGGEFHAVRFRPSLESIHAQIEKKLDQAEKTIEVKELLGAYEEFRHKGSKKNRSIAKRR